MVACINIRKVLKLQMNDETNSQEIETSQNNFDNAEIESLKTIVRVCQDIKRYWKPIATAFAAFAAIIGIMVNQYNAILGSRFDSIDEKLDTMNNTIGQFKEDVSSDLNDMKVSLNDLSERVSSLETDVAMIKGDLYGVQNCNVTDNFVPNMISLNAPVDQAALADETLIAIDEKTGQEFTVNDLVGQKLLLSYTVDDCENIFYGQFDEKNRWDGHCIINSYRNNKLWFATETQYDDGKVQYYKQAFFTGDNTIVESTRTHNDDGSNTGTSKCYTCINSVSMEFDFQNVKVTDLVGTTKVLNDCADKLVSYYKGDTKDCVYEDSTGNAYLVKYDIQGSVTLLYKGMFSNGMMNDNTGDAWSVIWNDSEYEYYKGVFKDGHRKDEELVQPVNQEQLLDYSIGQGFSCPLQWREK